MILCLLTLTMREGVRVLEVVPEDPYTEGFLGTSFEVYGDDIPVFLDGDIPAEFLRGELEAETLLPTEVLSKWHSSFEEGMLRDFDLSHEDEDEDEEEADDPNPSWIPTPVGYAAASSGRPTRWDRLSWPTEESP